MYVILREIMGQAMRDSEALTVEILVALEKTYGAVLLCCSAYVVSLPEKNLALNPSQSGTWCIDFSRPSEDVLQIVNSFKVAATQ